MRFAHASKRRFVVTRHLLPRNSVYVSLGLHKGKASPVQHQTIINGAPLNAFHALKNCLGARRNEVDREEMPCFPTGMSWSA